MAHITKNEMEKILISLPSLSEQQRVASILSMTDEKISICKKRKALLEKMKQGLMQTLLSNT